MPKPELVSSALTALLVSTTPKELEISVEKDDIIVVKAVAEDDVGAIALLISGGELTWTQQQRVLAGSECPAYLWTAKATENAKFKVKVSRENGGTTNYGFIVRVWRKAALGKSASGMKEGEPELSLTTESKNSAIEMTLADWNAVALGTPAYRSGPGTFTVKTAEFFSGRYTVYDGYYADAGEPGAKACGLTKPTGQKSSILLLEIKGVGEEEPAEEAGYASMV